MTPAVLARIVFGCGEQPGVVAIESQPAFHSGYRTMTRTDVLIALLSLGWVAWIYNVVRYRGLSRTARGLIAQNTRLIEANESLRWQNGSLLSELGLRKRVEPVARDPNSVIDLTARDDEISRRDDAESS